MHKFLTAGVTALALTTSSALAGGLAPVIVEDDVEVIEQDPASSVSPLLSNDAPNEDDDFLEEDEDYEDAGEVSEDDDEDCGGPVAAAAVAEC